MDREERLLRLAESWPVPRNRAEYDRMVAEFLAEYGEYAYLCPEQFHLGGLATTVELAEMAGIRPGLAVLDVACFLGGPARWLAAHRGCRVTGLDIDRGVIAAAKKLASFDPATDVEFVQGDALRMPFPAETFDVVWGQDAWPHRLGLFEECARVLRPGGVIAFTNSVLGESFRQRGELIYDAFTAEEYAQMLGDAGFTVTARENLSAFALNCWEELLARMEREKDELNERLGALRYNRELYELRGIVRDYRLDRIAHCRFVARKTRG
jgi:SAM-dependent methyltransferase